MNSNTGCVYLTICPSAYDRNHSYGDMCTIGDMVNLIYKPTITNIKNNTVYIMPYKFSRKRATKEYCVSQTALFLDIDGTATIQQVIEHLERLGVMYFLYTTFSHKHYKHKFRAIIPFSKPVPFEIADSKWYKEALKEMFPYNDDKTLKVQGFFSPNVSNLGNYEKSAFDGYYCRYREGTFFDVNLVLESKPSFGLLLDKLIHESLIESFSNKSVGNASNNKHVRYFLDTPFPTKGGDMPSYKAICAAVACNDKASIELIKVKMRSENWTEKEIEHKVNDAHNSLLQS